MKRGTKGIAERQRELKTCAHSILGVLAALSS